MTFPDSRESCLAKIPLFKEIPQDKLYDIAKDAGYQVVRPHTIIFKEGDPGDNFYMINSGKVRVSKTAKAGHEIMVAELGPGDFFGHLAILTDLLREVNVEAIEETTLTILSKDRFDEILREYSHVSFAFAKQMSQYLARNITVIKKKSDHSFRVIRSTWVDYIFIFALSLLCGIIFNYSNPNGLALIPNILPDKAIPRAEPSTAMAKHPNDDIFFVDARPAILYENMHIEGAVNIPLALFDIMYMMELSEIDKEKTIIVYGRTISSHYDEKVARKLTLRGHKKATILEGGLSAWKEKGYPVNSSKGSGL
jgi:rhodanese-related sulfurtransferase